MYADIIAQTGHILSLNTTDFFLQNLKGYATTQLRECQLIFNIIYDHTVFIVVAMVSQSPKLHLSYHKCKWQVKCLNFSIQR